MSPHWTRHPVLAGLVGVLAGGLAIALTEWLAKQLLGAPELSRPGGVSAGHFAAVLVAWVLGAGTAALVATAWCGGRSLVPGFVAAGVLLAGSVATMAAFPHPVWMMVGAPLLMPAAAWLGGRSRLARSA